MKNYPTNLARITALQEVTFWLYERAEDHEQEAENFRASIEIARKENGDNAESSYEVEWMKKAEALAKAFHDLADKLSGGVK